MGPRDVGQDHWGQAMPKSRAEYLQIHVYFTIFYYSREVLKFGPGKERPVLILIIEPDHTH